MIPLENDSPAGRTGLICQVATDPPPSVGVMSVMLILRVNTTVEGE